MTGQMRMTVLAALATLLACLSLSAVFDDSSWFWPVVAAVGAAATGCALGRRLGLPRLLVPVLGLAAVGLVITWLYARDVAVWGLLPGPDALRVLGETLGEGFADVRRFSSPAPPTEALVLLATGGAGVVAVLVDTLAVGYRSAALAGAPLLAMYAVPVAVSKQGVPWLLFVVGALGWMVLMLAEGRDRLSRWGRALDRRSTKGDNVFVRTPAEPLGVVGRRIGAAALGLALVVPALLPWGGIDLFGGVGGSGSGGNGSGSNVQTTSVNPFARIGADLTAQSETQLLTYTTTDKSPDYLSMVVLDTYSAKEQTWIPAKHSPDADVDATDLPAVGGNLPGTTVSTTIHIERVFDQRWLPILRPTQLVENLRRQWAYSSATEEIYSRTGAATTRNLDYLVTSRHLALSVGLLRGAEGPSVEQIEQYGALPDEVPLEVRTLAAQIVRGKVSEYDRALALQQYFVSPVNGFTYSTKLSEEHPTGDALTDFLRTKRGFCQQFAGAFAVMARSVGLPTRVVVGFTPGTVADTNSGSYRVTNRNAHAWPEVFFPGYGWIRFEPTVGGPSGVAAPTWATGLEPGTNPDDPSLADPTGGQVTLGEHNAQRGDDTDDVVVSDPAEQATVEDTTFPWKRSLVAVLLVALLLPGAGRLVRRRRALHRAGSGDPAAAVTAAWAEVTDTARDLGLPWSAARSPRGTAAWLSSLHVGAAGDAASSALAGMVERLRYAPPGVDVLRGAEPRAEAATLVRAMEAAAPRRDRWRARLMPASVLAAAGERGDHALDSVDHALARLRFWATRPFVRKGAADGSS